MQGFSLLKIANPHGTGCCEWRGTWSNYDTKSWKEHPEVGIFLLLLLFLFLFSPLSFFPLNTADA
jgi:hypothetical protein